MIEKEAASTEPGVEHPAVRLADGTLIEAHAVILVAGGTAPKRNIPGEDQNFGKGASYCAISNGFSDERNAKQVIQ